MWQHIKLFKQICPWDTLTYCWDVKQPTNKSLVKQWNVSNYWVSPTTALTPTFFVLLCSVFFLQQMFMIVLHTTPLPLSFWVIYINRPPPPSCVTRKYFSTDFLHAFKCFLFGTWYFLSVPLIPPSPHPLHWVTYVCLSAYHAPSASPRKKKKENKRHRFHPYPSMCFLYPTLNTSHFTVECLGQCRMAEPTPLHARPQPMSSI